MITPGTLVLHAMRDTRLFCDFGLGIVLAVNIEADQNRSYAVMWMGPRALSRISTEMKQHFLEPVT